MNETFEVFESRPLIPASAYKPAKRCPGCDSIYLTDTKCEACGRSLFYHPIGEPFSAKSLYGFKERYSQSLPLIVGYFPVFEDRKSIKAQSYIRHLTKRFDDLLLAFGTFNAIEDKNRRFFYVEMMALIDELLSYGMSSSVLQAKIENSVLDTGPLLTQELLLYLQQSQKENHLAKPWKEQMAEQKIIGLRLNYILKALLITATVVALAVTYYDFFNWQFGK